MDARKARTLADLLNVLHWDLHGRIKNDMTGVIRKGERVSVRGRKVTDDNFYVYCNHNTTQYTMKDVREVAEHIRQHAMYVAQEGLPAIDDEGQIVCVS